MFDIPQIIDQLKQAETRLKELESEVTQLRYVNSILATMLKAKNDAPTSRSPTLQKVSSSVDISPAEETDEDFNEINDMLQRELRKDMYDILKVGIDKGKQVVVGSEETVPTGLKYLTQQQYDNLVKRSSSYTPLLLDEEADIIHVFKTLKRQEVTKKNPTLARQMHVDGICSLPLSLATDIVKLFGYNLLVVTSDKNGSYQNSLPQYDPTCLCVTVDRYRDPRAKITDIVSVGGNIDIFRKLNVNLVQV